MDEALEKVIQKALDKNLITDEQPSLVSQCSRLEQKIHKWYFAGSF